ncbi:MAG: glycosyltransferase family 2 protein [Gaiellales bacterium]
MSIAELAGRGADGRAEDVIDLSVVIPSYGYSHFIGDSIDSVLAQTGLRVEVVVQDGGSTDGTIDLLAGYGDRVVWRSEPDRGQSDALNKACTLARGRWVAWLNADEFYLPGGLSELVAVGDRSQADVVYGDTVFVDGAGTLTRLLPEHPFSPVVLRSYGCFISTVSCIVRRSALGPQPIDADMRRMMDWDLYLRLLREGARFAYQPTPVGAFRAHDTRVTATESRGFFERLNLGDGFGREYAMMRARHGAFRARRSGHLVHGIMKVTSGAYRRQRRARRLRGANLRWFTSTEALQNCGRLRELCYGERGAG